MNKILRYITFLTLIICSVACTTENSSEELQSSPTISTGTIFKLTLDNQNADIAGTTQIYLRYNDGYYLERFCETKLGAQSVAIDPPVKSNMSFIEYNTERTGNGQTIITKTGHIDTDVSYTLFESDTTLYSIWGKETSSSEDDISEYNSDDGYVNVSLRLPENVGR